MKGTNILTNFIFNAIVLVGRVNMMGNNCFGDLKKRMCLKGRFKCIETRRRKNCEDPSTLT
jgi:hypothetical protein